MKQDEMMKKFTKKMNDNLEQFKTDKDDELKKIFKANGQAERMEKNQKLLDG
jgi:hypothetical protein